MPGAYLLADGRNGGLDEVGGRPVAARAADVEDEVLDELRTKRRVVDFGVELDGPDPAFLVRDCRECVGRDRGAPKPGGEFQGFVAVAHPYLDGSGQAFEELDGGVLERDLGVAVFALGGRADLSAEMVDDEVQSVADAEGGQVELEKRGVGFRSVGIVDGRWATGEDDAERLVGFNFRDGRRAGEDDGEDVQFADTASDELRILRAEIEDNNGLGVHLPVWQGAWRAVKKVPDLKTSRILPMYLL